MRRLVVSVFVASGLVLIGAGAASAEQAPTAGAAQAAAGKKVCKITDERLGELSGLVATEDGFITVNDSSEQQSRKRIFFLNDKCKVVDDVSYGGDGPRDTEDMALSPDGRTLWIADIGDNLKQRNTIGLWSMPADGSKKPKIHRLAYPAGKHDAEALLINGDGTPIIVTKEFGKAASIYTPTAELETDNSEGVPLRKVGDVTVPPSDTSGNALARIGRATIDGGAVARDGSKVVLRTYTDALEWDVKNGDVVAALKGTPRVTPLPDEPFGEAISFSPDGQYLYTVSDMGDVQDDVDNFILRYTPAAQATTTKAAAAGGAGGDKSGPSWYDDLTINDITYIVGGVGVFGAILVGLGIFGIMRSRKRPLTEPAGKGSGPDGPKPADAETELITVGGAAAGRGSGVYGGNRPVSGPGVYGGKPAPQGGGVYGGRPGPQAPARPGGGAQPGVRPGGGAQPGARPGGGAQPGARPGGGAQPGARPGGGAQPGIRPGGGAQPGARPGGGGTGQPGRGGGSGEPGRPGGGQPGRRPAAPGGQPGRPSQGGGRPGGGVYGPPPQHPPGPGRPGGVDGPGPRPSGYLGQSAGQPEPGRPAPSGMNGYADSHGRGRNVDSQGYGRHPYGR
jgi:hypothetical protein